MITLPNAPDVEESVLAACLIDSECAADTSELLTTSDFYKTDHQKIFDAIQSMSKQRIPVDLASVHVHSGVSAAHLAKIITEAPASTSITHHSEILKEKRTLRELIIECSNAIQKLSSANGNAQELIDAFNKKIKAICDSDHAGTYCKMSEITEESIERYEELQKADTDITVKTGYNGIDFITGGFRGPKLIVIAARPGVGKTAFMNCLSMNMAQRGDSVGIFELEMGKDELDDRWFSMMTGINSAKLSTGNGLSRDDWQKLSHAAAEKHAWKIMIDDSGGLTIDQLRRRAKSMRRDGADIIFIDQLSKIGGNRKLSSYERNTAHVEEIGFLKKELGCPIVLLCQLNREVDKRGGKLPMLSDLKLTGQIEEEADMVFLGHRDYIYTRMEEDLHKAVWDLAKNRSGPTYRFEMRWEPKLTRFYEIEERRF